ncbi:MAG TPA: hypothetical protein VG984_03765 [Candidatus Paceibacterota bacterium]|nr:hypothetical protein [Candidatus Paceibacterota bacterium]
MNILRTIKDEDTGSNISAPEKFTERKASRAVVFDREHKVALLHATKRDTTNFLAEEFRTEKILKQRYDESFWRRSGARLQIFVNLELLKNIEMLFHCINFRIATRLIWWGRRGRLAWKTMR